MRGGGWGFGRLRLRGWDGSRFVVGEKENEGGRPT